MTPVRDRIPIYCACLNDKAIRMVGELADGWMPTFWPWQQLENGMRILAEGAAKSGRDVNEISIAPFTTVIPMPDKEMSYHSARGIISFYIGGMGVYYHEMLSRMGYAENCDLVRDLYVAKQTAGSGRRRLPGPARRAGDRRRAATSAASASANGAAPASTCRSSVCPPTWGRRSARCTCR